MEAYWPRSPLAGRVALLGHSAGERIGSQKPDFWLVPIISNLKIVTVAGVIEPFITHQDRSVAVKSV
jgi:hypothetical protein